MRVLLIGGGGREHVLAWKLAASPRVQKLYCAPGNPGIAQLAECVDIDVKDNEAMLAFAKAQKIDLTVVGPELPLTNGIVDAFSAAGLRIFGPTRAAARIEGSKTFSKELMRKYGIPTARYEVFTAIEPAKAYIRAQGAPIVVKADGLAAGKGVVVAATVEEALAAVDMMLGDRVFGDSGARVVIEEFMQGEEATLLAFTDGRTVVPMVASQDHKAVLDGDKGPNTGGMGTYAPAPVMTPELLDRAAREVLQPVVDAMRAEGCPFVGCLYAGLMINEQGARVVEFNCRFGDPEAQVVLPLLATDLTEVIEACIDGRLANTPVRWKDEAAVCVVAAAGGYPGAFRRGDVIEGLDTAAQLGAMIFQAGTAVKDGKTVTNGGRVLGVTAVAPDLMEAIRRAYEAAGTIHFSGMHFRRDIAHRAVKRLTKD